LIECALCGQEFEEENPRHSSLENYKKPLFHDRKFKRHVGEKNNPRIGYAWVVFPPHISPTSTYIIYTLNYHPPKEIFFINVNPNKFKLIFPTPIYIQ